MKVPFNELFLYSEGRSLNKNISFRENGVTND
jgi:hypothetical protein